jgi:hypothetical protein
MKIFSPNRYSISGAVSINAMTQESLRHGKKFCKPQAERCQNHPQDIGRLPGVPWIYSLSKQ